MFAIFSNLKDLDPFKRMALFSMFSFAEEFINSAVVRKNLAFLNNEE